MFFLFITSQIEHPVGLLLSLCPAVIPAAVFIWGRDCMALHCGVQIKQDSGAVGNVMERLRRIRAVFELYRGLWGSPFFFYNGGGLLGGACAVLQ